MSEPKKLSPEEIQALFATPSNTMADSASTSEVEDTSPRSYGFFGNEEPPIFEDSNWALAEAKALGLDVGVPMATGIAASPLLALGPKGWLAYAAIQAFSGSASNYGAQKIRNPEEDVDLGENVASAALSMVPGIAPAKVAKLGKKGLIAVRGAEGAAMGASEAVVRQTIQIMDESNPREELDFFEIGFGSVFGGVIGGGLGRVEAGSMINRLGVSTSDAKKIQARMEAEAAKQIARLDIQIKNAKKRGDDVVATNFQKERDELKSKLEEISRTDREYIENLRKQAANKKEELAWLADQQSMIRKEEREARVFMDDASRLERRESADEFDDIYRAADGDPEDFVEMDLANIDWDKVEGATAMSREEFEAIEAGGRVIDETETDTAVIKKYQFENGSTQTITIDKIDPSIIAKFPKQAKGFDRSELSPQAQAYFDFYNQLDPLVNDLFPANTAKRYEWETDAPPISLAKKAFYKHIGIEEPTGSDPLSRISLQMGTAYNRPTPQIDFTDPKLKDAVAEGLFKDWARANNKDAEGLLGPNSGWTDARKRQELKKYADEAEAILTKIQKGFDAPTASGVISAFPKQAKAPEGFIGNVDEFDGVKGHWGKLATSSHDRPSRSFDPKSAFRYVEDTKTVHWWEAPTTQQKQLAREEMEARGYKVDRQRVLDVGDEAQWNEVHGIKPEGAASPAQDLIEQANRKRRAEKTIAESEALLESYVKRIEDHFGIGKEFTVKDDETGELITRIKYAEDTPWMDEKLKLSDWPHLGSQLEKQDEAFWRKELGFTDDDFYAVVKAQDDRAEAAYRGGEFPQVLSKEDYIKLADEVGFHGIRHVYSDFDEGLGKWKKTFKKAGISDDVIKQVEESRREWEFSGSPAGIAELSMRNIEGQPVHSIMQRIEEGKSTVSDIVSDLEKTFPNSPFLPLMRKLKTAVGGDSAIKGMDELERLERDPNLLTSIKEVNEEGRSFAILRPDGKVEVGINKNSETPIEHILHESVHAATMQKIQTHLKKHGLLDIEFTDVAGRAKAIDALLKDKSVPKAVKEYSKIIKFLDGIADEVSAKSGLPEFAADYWRNPLELITLGLSNRQFGNALKGIKYKGDQTLWQSLLDVVKSLLGIRPTHKANTAFDNLVKAGDDLFALKGQKPRMRPDAAASPQEQPPFKLTDEQKLAALEKIGMSDEDLTALIEGKTDVLPVNLGAFTTDTDVQRTMASVLEQVEQGFKKRRVKTDKKSLIKQATELRSKLDPSINELDYAKQIANESEEIIFKTVVADSMTFKAFQDWNSKMSSDLDFNDPVVLNDLMADLDRLGEFAEASSTISSSAGKLLQSRKVSRDQIAATISEMERKASKVEKEMTEDLVKYSTDMNPDELKKQLEKLGGLKALRGFAAELRLVRDPSKLGNLLKITRKSKLRKFADMYMELRYDMILSAPTTQGAAFFGNALMGTYSLLNQAVGGVITRELASSKMALRTAKNLWMAMPEAYRAAKIAAKNSQGEMALSSHYEKVGGKAFAMESTGLKGAVGETVENFGELVAFGPKGLVFQDEFYRHMFAKAQARALIADEYKQLVKAGTAPAGKINEYIEGKLSAYFVNGQRLKTRQDVQLEAIQKAREQGLEADEAAAFIKKYTDENWTTKLSSELEYIRDVGDRVTFQQEISGEKGNFFEDAASKVQELRNKEGVGGFVTQYTLPFIKTPVNIFKEAGGSASIMADIPVVGKMWKRSRAELQSSNPHIRAQARGRQVVGAGLWSAALYLAYNQVTTGSGPQNWKELQNKKNTGWLPNAVNISAMQRLHATGDSGGEQLGDRYVSLQRLDPLATITGLASDLFRAHENNEMGEGADRVANTIMLALSEQIAQKSYLQTVGEALDAITNGKGTDDSVNRFLKELVRGNTPAIGGSMSRALDPYVREVDSPLDVIRQRVLMDFRSLDPRRDIFGEEVAYNARATIREYNAVSPATYSEIKMDKATWITQELGIVSNFPDSDKVIPGLDLKEINVAGSERSLYDRLKQLYSETDVKKDVVEVYEDPDLTLITKPKKGQPFKDYQKSAVMSIMKAYRTQALMQLLEEYPELEEQYEYIGELTEQQLEGEELPTDKDLVAPELRQLLNQ